MIRRFSFKFPVSKKEALDIIIILDKERNNALLTKNKRERCKIIQGVYKASNDIFKKSRDIYVKTNDHEMRIIAGLFAKWMKKNGHAV